MTSSFNLNYQLPNFKILKFLIRSIISGLIMINTDSHSSVTRDIPAESTRNPPTVPGTSLPRWLPHPLTSPLFPDLTLLISFHHTDYNICHLSLSLSLGVSLSQGLWLRTTEMLSLKTFCQPNPQFLLSSFTSFNYILTSIFFSPLIVVSSVYLLRLTFSISNSWLLLQFLAPVLLTPAIFFTSFVQFLFSRFFSHQKINIKLPSISIFNAHFAISSNCFAFFLDLSLCLYFFTLHCLSIIDLPPVTPSFLPRLLASSLLSLPPSLL